MTLQIVNYIVLLFQMCILEIKDMYMCVQIVENNNWKYSFCITCNPNLQIKHTVSLFERF